MFNKVLLIEDDASHALLIKRAIRELAEEIIHTETIKQTLEALKSFEPDLIVTDLRLPDSVGVRHVGELKEASSDCPIIVLTSSTSLADAVEALKLGARDFIVKNFDSEFKAVFTLSLSRLFTSLELERERRELMKDLQLLQVAIENSHNALAVVGADGWINYSNSAFRDFAKLCGGGSRNIREAFSSVGNEKKLAETIEQKLNGFLPGAVWSTEVSVAGEIERAFDLSLSVIRQDEQNQRNESVIWVVESTERKRRERFQREILSTTTHDLKGPLGAVTVSVELLNGMLTKGSREHEIVLRIGSAAQGVLNLIEEFLSARRIQEGNLILRPIMQDVSALVSEVFGNYESIAAAKRIELVNETQTEGLMGCIEKAGIGRLLGNLISNALKFTPSGGKVSVQACSDSDGLHLVVRDTGSGMEASDIQKIFDRFSRLAKHSDIAGTGLGLFVVKSIVNAYGGRIEVTSQVNHGTIFDVILPYNPPLNERRELVSLDFA